IRPMLRLVYIYLSIRPRPEKDARPMKAAPAEEYLSVGQLAERIPYKPKTIRNLMCQGVFVEGVHFTRLTGRPIFIWSRVEKLFQGGAHGREGTSRAKDE